MVVKTRWYLKCFKVCFVIDQHHHDGEDVPYGEGCLYKQPKLYDGKTRWVDGPTWTHVIMSILAFLRSWGWLHLTIRMIILVIIITSQKLWWYSANAKFFNLLQFEHFNIGSARLKAPGVCWFVSILVIFYWDIGASQIFHWHIGRPGSCIVYAPIQASTTIDTY